MVVCDRDFGVIVGVVMIVWWDGWEGLLVIKFRVFERGVMVVFEFFIGVGVVWCFRFFWVFFGIGMIVFGCYLFCEGFEMFFKFGYVG